MSPYSIVFHVFNDTALPATLTALHVGLVMLRRHRARGVVLSPFVLPSFGFPIAPWLWTSPSGLAMTTGAHVVWIVLCELLAPAPAIAERPAAAAALSSARASRTPPARPATPAAWTAPVLAVLDETPDIKTFRVRRPSDFDFRAGQFVPIRVKINGQPHVRCYSISSSPEARGYLEISVRRQGVVSSTLHALVRPGASLSLGRPAGQFSYPTDDDRPIALIAGGVGVTPLLSMLRHAVAADPTRPIALLYSARREHDIAFLTELRMIAERHPQVRIAITLTQPVGESHFRTGRVDAALIRQQIADPQHTIFMMCGPAPMIADLNAALGQMGVPSEQVRSEAFETAIAASVLHSETTVKNRPDHAAAGGGDSYKLEFALSGHHTMNTPSRTLLEAAEAEGIAIPSACRAGVCQACRTRVTSGDVDCRSDMLAVDDREAGFVLPCVSWAVADCTLEA